VDKIIKAIAWKSPIDQSDRGQIVKSHRWKSANQNLRKYPENGSKILKLTIIDAENKAHKWIEVFETIDSAGPTMINARLLESKLRLN
jgi:hypothetical protein